MTYYHVKVNMGIEADSEMEAYMKLHHVIQYRLMFAGEDRVISMYQICEMINKSKDWDNDMVLQQLEKAFQEVEREERGIE